MLLCRSQHFANNNTFGFVLHIYKAGAIRCYREALHLWSGIKGGESKKERKEAEHHHSEISLFFLTSTCRLLILIVWLIKFPLANSSALFIIDSMMISMLIWGAFINEGVGRWHRLFLQEEEELWWRGATRCLWNKIQQLSCLLPSPNTQEQPPPNHEAHVRMPSRHTWLRLIGKEWQQK